MSFLQPNDRNQEVFPQFQNGRVININEKPVEWYQPFDGNKPNDSFQNQALYGIQSHSLLGDAFFSKANVQLVHDMVRYQVYIRSDKKHLIGEQSNLDLEVIMRSIYLQFSRNLQDRITEQIKELNMKVVNVILPRILSSIEQYIGYLHRISTLPQEIELPKNVSSKGTRLLRPIFSTF